MDEFRSRLTQSASTSSALIAGLGRVVDELAKRGITLPNSGRVPTYIRTLKRLRGKPVPLEDPADVTEYLTAVVEGQYVFDTYAGLVHPPEVASWPGKLRLALEGRPELTAEDKSRAFMMELLVAAAAHRGGLEVHLAEPDVRVVHEGQEFGVAAKRVRSLKKLGNRVRDGAAQVKGEKLKGFVAVDLTVALGFHERFEVVPRFVDAEGLLSAVRQRIADTLPDDAVAAWLAGKPMVAGVVGFTYVPGVIQDGSQPFILKLWVGRPSPTADRSAQKFLLDLPSLLHLA